MQEAMKKVGKGIMSDDAGTSSMKGQICTLIERKNAYKKRSAAALRFFNQLFLGLQMMR